jgi:hypothetical protein
MKIPKNKINTTFGGGQAGNTITEEITVLKLVDSMHCSVFTHDKENSNGILYTPITFLRNKMTTCYFILLTIAKYFALSYTINGKITNSFKRFQS